MSLDDYLADLRIQLLNNSRNVCDRLGETLRYQKGRIDPVADIQLNSDKYLKRGDLDTLIHLQEITGITPNCSKMALQEKFAEYLRRLDYDPYDDQYDDDKRHLFVVEKELLQKLMKIAGSKIKLPKNEIQRKYAKYIKCNLPDDLKRLRELIKATGIEPDIPEEEIAEQKRKNAKSREESKHYSDSYSDNVGWDW